MAASRTRAAAHEQRSANTLRSRHLVARRGDRCMSARIPMEKRSDTKRRKSTARTVPARGSRPGARALYSTSSLETSFSGRTTRLGHINFNTPTATGGSPTIFTSRPAPKTSVRMAFVMATHPPGVLIAEKAPPLSPIAQEMRLVTGISLVRSHDLHVRRSDVPDRKIRNQRRLRISLQIIAGQDEQAPGVNNSVRLAIGNASAQRLFDSIEHVFGKLLGVVEQLFPLPA